MNTHKHSVPIVWKGFVVLLLLMLAFQSSGMNSMAAAANRQELLQGESPPVLTCSPSTAIPKFCDVQVILMLDDSGSMRSNDPAFGRNAGAKKLINVLATKYYLPALMEQAKHPETVLPIVKVAVIHFGGRVLNTPHWINLDLNTDWNTELFNEIDLNRVSNYGIETTNFVPAFAKAQELLGKRVGCTRRTVLLFTDGTPEDRQGRLQGEALDTEINSVKGLVGQLDAQVIVTGFKVDPNYWDKLEPSWKDVVKPLTPASLDLAVKRLAKDETVSGRIESILAFLGDATQSEPAAKVPTYQNLSLELANEPLPLKQGQSSDIQFRLLDESGNPVQPNDAANVVTLNAVSSTSTAQEIPVTPNGDGYQFSWTPQSAGINQFNVAYNFVDKNISLLTCSGIINVDVSAPPGGSGIVVTEVFDHHSEIIRPDQSITIPIHFYSSQTVKILGWDSKATVLSDHRSLKTEVKEVKQVDKNNSDFNLIIYPSGIVKAEQIAVEVEPKVVDEAQNPVAVPKASTTIPLTLPPPCTYSAVWNVWFWPLLIGLVGLMILLLILRAGSRRDTAEDPRANRDIFRIRDWHVLFWPLVALLILLILVPVMEWNCILPPWLFLVSLLFWLVMSGLLRFLPGHNIPRSRSWALLIALLALAFLGFLTVALPVLAWLWLVIALIAILVVVWYISPYEPLAVPTVPFNLEIGTSSQLAGGALLVPLQVSYDERDGEKAPSQWTVRKWHVIATPPGKDLSEEVVPEDEYGRKASLTLSGMEKDINSISVQVSADVEADGRLLRTPRATATILVVPTDIPEPADNLKELEGIEKGVEKLLNAQGIYTFKELAQKDWPVIDGWLKEKPWGKMMDPKTWPQQAKLADIAKRYGKEDDKQNYEAYKVWLKDGIEPDEHNHPEKPRRPVALLWNGIPQFTPIVLSLPLTPSSVHHREAIILPMQLDHEAKEAWLSDIEWKVSAKAMPGGTDLETSLHTLDADRGQYELVIAPVPVPVDGERSVEEIQVSVQALVNGRSIEIYDQAVTVQVSAPAAPDDLEDLEGIGPAVRKAINQHGIFTFKQLANTDPKDISTWLNAEGLKMMDPKTWPQQARLADVAKRYGRDEDLQSYQAYKAWLKNGIEPDEVDKDEKDRRPVALPWPLSAERRPDPLEDLEGIGNAVAEMLNDNGIFTFRQLAKADVRAIKAWLDDCGYEQMDPKTWPQQAKLADIAKDYDRAEDQQNYQAYKAWLKNGIEPDEVDRPERDRRTVALVWYGTAERTEAVYSELFRK